MWNKFKQAIVDFFKGKDSGKEIDSEHYPFLIPSEHTMEGKIIKEALKHIGIKETRKNYSARLAKLLKDTTWQEPWPWCQYFCNAIGINVLGENWEHGNGGSTQSTYDEASNRGLVTQIPKVGYMITWQNREDKKHGHVGWIVGIKDETTIYTIEGNAGNRSGIFERSSIQGFGNKTIRGFIKTY